MEEAEFFQTPSNGVITLKIKILRYGVHAITALNFSDNMSESSGTVEILGGEQGGQMNVATYLYDYRNVPTKLRKNINNTAHADESGR